MIAGFKFFRTATLCTVLGFAALSLHAEGAHAQYPGFGDPGSEVSGAGIVPVVPQVDGGVIPTGATAQVVVRFRNDGAQPVQTGLIRLYPSSTVSASVSMNQCEEAPLEAGAECAIALSVKGLQIGAWRVEMLMSHSGRTRLVTTTVSGQVESTGEASESLASDIETIPSEIDFETLNESQTLVKPVILRNITSVPINISEMFVDSGEQSGFKMKAECKKLEPGQACIAILSWSPQLAGRVSGVFVVRHDGPTGLASVPLKGEFDPEEIEQVQVFPSAVPGRGLLAASLTEVDFGTDVQTASTMTVSLVNAGDMPLTIKDIRISGSDNGLSYKEDGCMAGDVLAPIEACPLTINWSPTRVGSVFDDVQILHDGARGILVLPIRGAATSTVSQDQKAIMLSGGSLVEMTAEQVEAAVENTGRMNSSAGTFSAVNPTAALDGYKITSFSPTRAIINGPGGSRLVFDNEEIVLGGVPWFVVIQKSGIEFLHQGNRILLLFDRSLSSINRVTASSSANTGLGANAVGAASTTATGTDAGAAQ